MRNDGSIGSVWRLALSALLALALMVGPVAAHLAMAVHNCGLHAGTAGSQAPHHGANAEIKDQHAAHHGTHDHADATAKSLENFVNADGPDDTGMPHRDDCCSTMCQSECMKSASFLIHPLLAFSSFSLPVPADFVSVVPGQPDRPPSPLLSI